MKYLQIPKGVGYWSIIYFNIGLLGLLAASAFFVLNILFSALGAIQWGGGQVIFDFTAVMFPAITIISGGRIGLIMGIIAGILASFTEGRFWVVNSENERNKTSIEKRGLLFLIGFTFILYDILSSYYALNGGVWYTTFFDSMFSMAVTFILFSVGPEMLMVFFFEMMMENSKEGWSGTTNLIKNFVLGLFSFFGDLVNGESKPKIDHTPIITQSHEIKKGRGRPRSDRNPDEIMKMMVEREEL